MAHSLSLWSLIANADWIVKLVMLLLLAASVWSWTIIIRRIRQYRQTKQQLQQFERQFWSGKNLSTLYHDLRNNKENQVGISRIFVSGFRAFMRLRQKSNVTPATVLDDVQRTLKVAHMREADRLEEGLSVLATVGSVSPYVGLFGTVWGIMRAFIALGGVQQATLSMVAPGIAEALIATAIGLFAAIPAVIAYNRLTAASEKYLNDYENFQDELVSILHRELHSSSDQSKATEVA